jgi:protein TonB
MAGNKAEVRKNDEVARLEARYLAELQRAIARHRFYPRKARKRRLEGKVTVSFVIYKDGKLKGITVANGSSHELLDKAALDTLHKLRRFKPIPDAIGREQWKLRVPINFALR